ncbi:MAG: NUDIX domain-containing protein, partial [Pseudomonadota bacterium]
MAQLFSCLHREPIIPDTPSMVDPTGDHILNPDFARYNHPSGLRLAAVLIAVEAGASEPEVVLTVRTKNLNAHAGQIAFPGGRVDEGETAEQAAV